MKLILSIDQNWGIGSKGQLLFHISEDLKRFKKITTGNIIVMGRSTLESLPGGRPLKNRINVVFSQTMEPKENLVIVRDVKDLDQTLRQLNPKKDKEVYFIGGAHLALSLMDKMTGAEITRLERTYPEADVFLPNLDADPDWTLVAKSDPISFEDTTYAYLSYQRLG